ncbi:tyrosine-sulfated glycopeptide receptor 1-like [Pyrus ussuriensis x Pyrus communis]|uniref:Tyrosine-sulfated glycopeptide receptor 1-like n=1 Tax=Pyrus ussuriensis x Pyrus communis TaxID=2448454 RepID=A0A5N5GDL4_9ROSA|nr:tyrosine-sulfated glycopeptide receptor 1-like [Pyrus ussuriensis x Pyrus communis]
MKHDKEKEKVKVPTILTLPSFRLLCYLGQLVFVLLLLACSASAACDGLDRDALLSLAFKAPLNWSASTDCCLWDGITCDPDEQSHVVAISLPSRGLSGVVSPAITNLTRLTHLDLSHNSLLGSLPDDLLSALPSLEFVDLSFNRLIGRFPQSSNQSSHLQIINLSSNFFNGTIPSSILVPSVSVFNVSNNSFSGSIPVSNGGNHTSLTFLDLSFNEFTYTIPLGIGLCSKLQTFRAGFNDLNGSLPDEIFMLADLKQLSLPFNSLSGPLIDGIMNLTNLRILELYSNQFLGSIPGGIGNLFRLEKLLLYVNNFTGALPPSLANCTNLSTLNLRLNNLTGELSAFNFSTLQRLTTLDLSNNNFSGELPQSLYSCKSLTAIKLASNQLTGEISPEIVALESLSFLSISTNNLTNVAGAFRILKVFAIAGCQLTGQVPTMLAKVMTLEVLDLSFNLITGSIPGWMGSLPNLFYVDLSNNLLGGGFPIAFCGMPVLTTKEAGDMVDRSYLELPVFVVPNSATYQQYNQLSNLPPAIYLGNNSLTGSIPSEIGRLKYILVLDLSYNNFTGSIPEQISNLTNLEKLDLSYNHLSGGIPASLGSLHFLSSLSVAYNDLQGIVPSGGQFDTFTNSSFEGNPGLCGFPTGKLSCPQSPLPVVSTAQKSNTHGIFKALFFGISFGIFFGIGFGLGLNIDDKRIPFIARRMMKT